ncbi:DUF2889 domain-containing protein [Novosphingobium sp. TH158]|uniref:DUF2889 domain-containing protein n=1 Tax=Novosphingobium sp. TH158 TaxID=2067455 RepID=UPI0020B13612|nr:DUF2889 domain-containing protein [Novosphingobium sp. TH158]
MTDLKPVRSTANPVPVRRAGSIRRTSSIDVTWPDGGVDLRRFEGRARDLVRRADGSDLVRAAGSMTADLDFERKIVSITADPAPAELPQLVGQKGGGHLRVFLRDLMPGLIAEAHPLYLLLDDISGTSLVSNWAWSQWGEDWLSRMQRLSGAANFSEMLAERTNVCWGFQPGFSSHDPHTRLGEDIAADGMDLRNPADPEGWHAFPESEGLSFRRARRIDVWREADAIRVEASFQDSAPRREGGRAALHEYILRVSLDPSRLVITSLEPEARVLPFRECPGAIANARKLVGTPMDGIREAVLDSLRGPAGCTHLNDALRALADVPELLAALDGQATQPA